MLPSSVCRPLPFQERVSPPNESVTINTRSRGDRREYDGSVQQVVTRLMLCLSRTLQILQQPWQHPETAADIFVLVQRMPVLRLMSCQWPSCVDSNTMVRRSKGLLSYA